MKLDFLKLALPGLQVHWRGKYLPRGDFKLHYSYRLSQSFKHSLSLSSTLNLSSTLSQSLKHSRSEALSLNLWSTLACRQTFIVHDIKRSDHIPTIPSPTFRRSPHPSLEISQTLAVKHSPSSTCNKITVTVKRYPLSSDHIPTSLPTKVLILLCLKVCVSKKNLSFLNNDSIWV